MLDCDLRDWQIKLGAGGLVESHLSEGLKIPGTLPAQGCGGRAPVA